ncbi:MAG TPA: sugar:proton symporter [Actinospica sp.]|nr:sugar:proton symporter [Actinospica sp.]
MVQTPYETEVETGPGRQIGRLLATLIGVALLVVSAFTDWTPSLTGDRLDIRALVRADFAAQSDFVRTVGGVSVLIALVALIGLVDRTGWLTRLAGAAALIVFVLYAIEAYRVFGHDFGTAVGDLRTGAWLQFAGGVVLLIGGYLGSRVAVVPAAVESEPVHPSNLEGRR